MLDTLTTDPLESLAETGGVLAVVTGVEGSAYRPVGAMMAYLADGARVGTVSSGCIEGALALEAEKAAEDGQVRQVRYGRGSPWIDIQLPCGAGLDITLWPCPKELAQSLVSTRTSRCSHSLILPAEGLAEARVGEASPAGWQGDRFILPRIPPLRFEVFGTGIETIAFSSLAEAAGYKVRVSSTDEEVLAPLPAARTLRTDPFPDGLPDDQTAIVLFFHDHERELPILQAALESSAFWIGAQGSARARAARLEGLEAAGVTPEAAARLQERIGLIPSARDPQTLAISVLADIVGAYKTHWFDPYFSRSGTKEAA